MQTQKTENKILVLKLGIQTYQILKNDAESRRFYQKFLAFLESELY